MSPYRLIQLSDYIHHHSTKASLLAQFFDESLKYRKVININIVIVLSKCIGTLFLL